MNNVQKLRERQLLGKAEFARKAGVSESTLDRAERGSFVLEACGVSPLPPEAIGDGALMNNGAIVDAIRQLVGQFKLKNREVAIGVSGHSVIIKKISMPRMTREELEESIQWEAEQYIPFDVKDVNIDVQILNPEGADPGTGQMAA